MRMLPLTLACILLFTACQQGQSTEQRYLESITSWFSAGDLAWTTQAQESQLSDLMTMEPVAEWRTRHRLLISTYRSMIITAQNEDALQREEAIWFASRGDDHIPACDIIQYLSGVSSGYWAACQASTLAFQSWAELQAVWKIQYIDYYRR